VPSAAAPSSECGIAYPTQRILSDTGSQRTAAYRFVLEIERAVRLYIRGCISTRSALFQPGEKGVMIAHHHAGRQYVL